MSRHQARHRTRQRYGALAASTAVVALLIVAGWANSHPRGQTSTPTPSVAVRPVVLNSRNSPGGKVLGSPTSTPNIWTPAPSYPVVDSCKPSSVPGSISVSGSASRKAGSFTLHVPILMYHRIVPSAEAGDSSPGLVVPPETFSAQLDAIKAAGWHTITMATLANDLWAHVQPLARSFVITIDDGWADGYTYALPVLEQHGFVATYFVVAGRIDKPDNLTSGELQSLAAAGDEIGDHTMDHVDLEKLPASTLHYEIDAAAARIAQATGRWPESFAYPSGGVDAAAAAGVAACGEMRSAVIEEPVPAAKPGASSKPVIGVPVALETWTNRFEIPRVRITPNTRPDYLASDLKLLSEG